MESHRSRVRSTATGVTYRLDFFVNNATNASGYGEGGIFLGSGNVTTAGDGTAQFLAAFPVMLTYQQFITATTTDPANNTSEFSRSVRPSTPPEVVVDPMPTNNVPIGQPAGFCVQGAGSPPIFYQWRHNGVNIPGATNACYVIPVTELPDGGTYDVVIINSLGASLAGQAPLTLDLPRRPCR